MSVWNSEWGVQATLIWHYFAECSTRVPSQTCYWVMITGKINRSPWIRCDVFWLFLYKPDEYLPLLRHFPPSSLLGKHIVQVHDALWREQSYTYRPSKGAEFASKFQRSGRCSVLCIETLQQRQGHNALPGVDSAQEDHWLTCHCRDDLMSSPRKAPHREAIKIHKFTPLCACP